MTLVLSKRHGNPWWMTDVNNNSFGSIFFDEFFPEAKGNVAGDVAPRVNFSEKDGTYYLAAKLPGINKDDITIAIEGNCLTLKDKKEEKKEENRPGYYLKETRYGSRRNNQQCRLYTNKSSRC